VSAASSRSRALAGRVSSLVSSAASSTRRLTKRSGWLELPAGSTDDVTVKPINYLPVYEEFLGSLRMRRFSMLELGVWKADSLTMWRDAFPRATIVGVDISPPAVDLGPRVHVISGDQGDEALLAQIAAQYAPQGFDVIIDDAAHVGDLSARSLRGLYRQHLRPGGLYIVEDWGAGYSPAWPDGGDPTVMVTVDNLDEATDVNGPDGEVIARRMASHDYGLVGLIKRLVDHSAAGTLRTHQPDWVSDALPIEWMRVQDGLVIIKKPGATP
jgi:SAM-dependent methyltransferase